MELRQDTWVLKPTTTIAEEPSDSGAFIIRTGGIFLDMVGAELKSGNTESDPDQFAGRGIVIKGAKNVTIRNARVHGFKIAIYAEDCPGLTIENCDVSNNYRQRLKSTPAKEDESDWLYGHENDNNEWLRYGAGIYLLRCDGATIKNCTARDGQNGICLVNSNDVKVIGCDMSFMSGWGLAMWRSSQCEVIGNRFDYCIRGYSHGVYARGQDSTGILVYEQCSDNVFAYNRATHGGDGFFLYAGNETVNKTGEGGCNRNLVYKNDFSHAVANGIEATFSDQNVFMENVLNYCMHGVWGGYSRNSVIARNTIKHCKYGISIEHGDSNLLLSNAVESCATGAWLWWDDDKELLGSTYCRKQPCGSTNESLIDNSFVDDGVAVRAESSKGLVLRNNSFRPLKESLVLSGHATVAECFANDFVSGALVNKTESRILGDGNRVAASTRVTGPVDLRGAPHAHIGSSAPVTSGEMVFVFLPPPPLAWPAVGFLKIPALEKGRPVRPDNAPVSPLPGTPEGKEHVVITEWGPVVRPAPKR